jgi:nitrile hydratase subunit beta
MNGAHDLGGMMGFGPVAAEPEGVLFHADWEKRVLALALALGSLGEWNIDMSRHARESLHPADYLTASYYEIWVKGLEKLLVSRGLATRDEIAAGSALHPPKPTGPPLDAPDLAPTLAKGTPYDRPPEAPARFSVGEAVRTRNINPTGHTRLPRYARDKRGRIDRVYGVYVFADANAQGLGTRPQWLYCVRFSGAELWGREGDPALDVSIDAWESYLEGAEA